MIKNLPPYRLIMRAPYNLMENNNYIGQRIFLCLLHLLFALSYTVKVSGTYTLLFMTLVLVLLLRSWRKNALKIMRSFILQRLLLIFILLTVFCGIIYYFAPYAVLKLWTITYITLVPLHLSDMFFAWHGMPGIGYYKKKK